MPENYVPILMFAGLAFLFPAVTLWIARFLRPEARNIGSRLEPYECGIKPEGDARGRFGVRFYVIAILFVIFDVEVVFLGILIIGYIWLYKKGALEWI